MKRIVNFLSYFLLMSSIFVIDRVTKNLALALDGTTISLLPGLSFVYEKNRGISWGMFYAHSFWAFFCMTTMVGIVIGILAIYTYQQWRQGKTIVGEVLVFSGAISNLFDRIVHGGVIDFILCSYRGWNFPVFNSADIAIVIGVGIMLIEFWY